MRWNYRSRKRLHLTFEGSVHPPSHAFEFWTWQKKVVPVPLFGCFFGGGASLLAEVVTFPMHFT